MDVLSAFKEPAVIISLSFSILLYLFPNQGRRAGEWIVVHLGTVSRSLKTKIRLRIWRCKKETVRKIRNPYEIQWQIIRTYSFMLLFAISITTYVMLIALGPLEDIGQLPASVQYFIYSPVLVMEALWINQRENTRMLIKCGAKRVTNQFCSPLRGRTR